MFTVLEIIFYNDLVKSVYTKGLSATRSACSLCTIVYVLLPTCTYLEVYVHKIFNGKNDLQVNAAIDIVHV